MRTWLMTLDRKLERGASVAIGNVRHRGSPNAPLARSLWRFMEMIGISGYLKLVEYQGHGLKVKGPRLISEESTWGPSTASVEYTVGRACSPCQTL